MKRTKYIIGIDEVGRGALAGPVTVAAFAATVNSKFQIPNSKLKLKDSKKLSPKQREIWFKWIKQHSNILQNVRMFYSIASVSPKIIDKINISQAANLAAKNAFMRLMKNSKLKIKNCAVFLDGGLYLGNKKFLNLKSYILNPRTIVKGDEKIPAIALASIIAKVSRDKEMIRLHGKYPNYGFDKHKGYGTKRHFKTIKKHGPSKIHRLTFLKKIKDFV